MMLQHSPSLGHPKLSHPLRTINGRNTNPLALGFGSRNGFRPSTIRCGSEEEDGYYMRRCVELARRAVGCTSPNPMVGCVIVKDRVVVGEGFHPKAGQPHAEVFALRDAGDIAESATAYVSLEPCNHYGRTPPCTESLIRAKVKRVVVGMVDPNPIVASKGVERLRDSGIEVTVGVEEILCKKLNEAYIHKMLTGKPFVTLRYSLSTNGMIPHELGKGAEEPGGYYSQLLQEYDGIVISSNSSLITSANFPTSEEDGANQPIVIIVPESTNSTINLPILPTDIGSRATVFLNNDTKIDPQTENLIKQQGLEAFHSDKLTLSALLDYCSSRGMCSILFDLRSADDCDWLIQEGLEEKLLKKVVLEVCPNFGEGKRETLIKLGRNTVNVKDPQSKIVKETYLIEGYIP